MKRGYVPILLLITVGTLIFILYPSDKRRIRTVLNRMEDAIVREDVDEVMENISYNYRDAYGNNYLLFKKRVQMFFNRFDDIGIEKVFKEISISGDNAEALMNVRVMVNDGRERAYIIGNMVDSEEIKVYLEKTGYRWMVRKVDLENFNRRRY